MKILFISSANARQRISPIIRSQGNSLKLKGEQVEYYGIAGKGVWAYIKHIRLLRKFIKKQKFNIYHAHYSLSAITASLAGCKPLVVSLMGSDVMAKSGYRFLIRIFNVLFWKACIVKSESMKSRLGIKHVRVIPNGVDLDTFVVINQKEAREKLYWHTQHKHILFAANPERYEKNFKLAQEAFTRMAIPSVEMHTLINIPPDKMPLYYAAADVMILTSLWEGSPNVIKEAMACNCPVVSTDVGDVKQIVNNTEGCFISEAEPEVFSGKILTALKLNKRTNGRQRIIDLQLDSESVAGRLLDIYTRIKNND
ncbi:MAG: glycosyltransferase family 4 protein [Bacteroidales bacterium]|nr:glycosyltransferase family 4 protein [Bacteroidales bacterium]